MLEKKSLLFLFAISLTLSTPTIYAAVTKNNNPPYKDQSFLSFDSQPRYEFSIAALALKPAASNLNYVIFNKPFPLPTPNWNEQELRPTYSFAFELGGRYFLGEKSDLSLDWTHLNSSTSSSVGINPAWFLGPDYEIGPTAAVITQATGNALFKYDVVNFNFGQSKDLTQHFAIRFFGGLSDGFLREQVTSTYSGTLTSGANQGPFSMQQQVTSSFIGAGPRFGFEANYTMNDGFGFLGEAAISTLIGSSHARTTFVGQAPQVSQIFGINSNDQDIQDQNHVEVVPGVDAKLGMSYKCMMGRAKDISFMVQAGYQAAVYINAINQYLPGTLVSSVGLPVADLSSGSIFVATMNHTQSNYSVQGPFLKAVWQF